MPGPIVVEIYEPAPAPEAARALLSACTRAAGQSECVLAEERGSAAPLGVAIVRRQGDAVRVEVGLRRDANSQWTTRELRFQPDDDELERCRTIGFTIGTVVAGTLSGEERRPPEETRSEPTSAAAPAATPPAESRRTLPSSREEPEAPSAAPDGAPRRMWIDAGPELGLGLLPGPARVGGTVRAGRELGRDSLFLVLDASYAERLPDAPLDVRWWSFGAGLGLPIGPGHGAVALALRLQAVAQRLSVTATEDGGSESASRWKPGLTTALDGRWSLGSRLAGLTSASVSFDPERTVIRVGGEEIAETPALGLSGFIGLRWYVR